MVITTVVEAVVASTHALVQAKGMGRLQLQATVVGFHPYTSTDKWTVNITVIRAEFDSTHTRSRIEKIQKNLGKDRGLSGAYETRTRDLLRDRQAF